MSDEAISATGKAMSILSPTELNNNMVALALLYPSLQGEIIGRYLGQQDIIYDSTTHSYFIASPFNCDNNGNYRSPWSQQYFPSNEGTGKKNPTYLKDLELSYNNYVKAYCSQYYPNSVTSAYIDEQYHKNETNAYQNPGYLLSIFIEASFIDPCIDTTMHASIAHIVEVQEIFASKNFITTFGISSSCLFVVRRGGKKECEKEGMWNTEKGEWSVYQNKDMQTEVHSDYSRRDDQVTRIGKFLEQIESEFFSHIQKTALTKHDTAVKVLLSHF